MLAAQDAPPANAADAVPPPAARAGAPTDDYGFVAWCRGALAGHMALYEQVLPEVARVREAKAAHEVEGKTPAETTKIRARLAKEAARDEELDREQMKAGRDYLALYDKALHAAEEAGAPHRRGETLTGEGYRIWSAARAAPDGVRLYSYMMWELPGRCETSAKTLADQSSLLGAAFRSAEAEPKAEPPAEPEAKPDAAPTADAPKADAAPAPEAPAAPPADPAAPPAATPPEPRR